MLTRFVSLKNMKKEKTEIINDERRLYDLKPMNAVLGPLARRLLGEKAFVEADIIRNWDEIAGKEWSEFTQPVKVDFKKGERKNGTLVLQVASGAIALEMQMREKALIGKLNSYFGYEAVDRLKIVQNAEFVKNQKQPTDNSEKKLVSKDQENYINQQINGIECPQLVASLRKLGQAIIAEAEKEQKSGEVYKKN